MALSALPKSQLATCFLVVLHHTMDDLVVCVCTDKAEAIEFADTLEESVTDEIRDAWDTDASTPVGVSVIEVIAGLPRRKVWIKDLGE